MSDTIWTPPSRERQPHPREGFTAAIYIGTTDRPPFGDAILIEIVECYGASAQMLGYHYRPYDLSTHQAQEVKTIGALPFDRMVAFSQARYPGLNWRRLR